MATEDKDGFNIGMLAPLAGPIGYGLGQLFGPSRDTLRREQLEDQQKLIDQQGAANRQQAQFTNDLQYDMWNKTNYGAQVKHLNAAGLNPALLYGKGGGGGATTGSAAAAGVSGGAAATAAATEANQLQKTMMMTQMGLTAAQTAKTNAETKKIEGVDTDLGKAQAGKIGVETGLGNIQLEIAGKTREAAIQTIEETAAKALADAVQSQQQQVITEETMKSQISKIKTEAIGAIIENEAKRSGIQLNNARIQEITEAIKQRWSAQDIDVENNKRMTEAMLWGAGIHAAGSVVNGIMNIATKGKTMGGKAAKGKWDDNVGQMEDFNKAMGW